VARAAAWDAEEDRRRREAAAQARTQALEEMHERHRRLAQAVLARVAMRLLGSDEYGVQALDPNTLSPFALVRWFEVGVKLERLALGVPDAHVQPKAAGPRGRAVQTTQPLESDAFDHDAYARAFYQVLGADGAGTETDAIDCPRAVLSLVEECGLVPPGSDAPTADECTPAAIAEPRRLLSA